MAKKLSARAKAPDAPAVPLYAPESEDVQLKCAICRNRGDSRHFSDCTKCRETVCNDCCKSSIRKEEYVVTCDRCRDKCKDCAALKKDPAWGGLYADCEECDKRCCMVCIQRSRVWTRGRKHTFDRKWLCPKCIEWYSSK